MRLDFSFLTQNEKASTNNPTSPLKTMSGNVFSESATGQDLHQVKQNNEGSGILEGPKVRTRDL